MHVRQVKEQSILASNRRFYLTCQNFLLVSQESKFLFFCKVIDSLLVLSNRQYGLASYNKCTILLWCHLFFYYKFSHPNFSFLFLKQLTLRNGKIPLTTIFLELQTHVPTATEGKWSETHPRKLLCLLTEIK